VRRRAAPLFLVAALAAGCGDQLGAARGDHVLRGGIHYAGGPAGAVDPRVDRPGTVDLLRDGEKVDEATLDDGERFAFKVRAGTYRLATRLGDVDCTRDVPVEREIVDADLMCAVK
jgi:hypothetical protein